MQSTPGQDRTGDLQRARLTSQPLSHRCFAIRAAAAVQVLMQATRHGPTPKPEPGTSLGACNVCTIAHCSSAWNGGQLPKRIAINCTIAFACVLWLQPSTIWPCGRMGKALALGTNDCRFESCQGKFASQRPNVCCMCAGHVPLCGRARRHAFMRRCASVCLLVCMRCCARSVA